MRKNQKGFTLLELLISILLLSIFLAAIWQFFAIAYTRYHQNQVRMDLDSNARNVNQFIKDSIRKADRIVITVDAGSTSIYPIEKKEVTLSTQLQDAKDNDKNFELRQKVNPSNIDVNDGVLTKITLANEDGSKVSYIKMEAIPSPSKKQGKYKLYYEADGERTTICDVIENIEVSREKDSDYVTFKCTLNWHDETKDILKVKENFSESLQFKKSYTTT